MEDSSAAVDRYHVESAVNVSKFPHQEIILCDLGDHSLFAAIDRFRSVAAEPVAPVLNFGKDQVAAV